jgi:hemolysin-activating ACP:hemolysin acyltransferase
MSLSLPIATAQNNHNLLLNSLASNQWRLAWRQELRPTLRSALNLLDAGIHQQYIRSTQNLRSGSGYSQTYAANFSAK